MSNELQPGTVLHGRYRVARALGGGGMGEVYLAEDLRARREVALKVANLGNPAARDLFQHEAATLRRLQHHGLPRVWDVLSDTQRDVLVMEYIAGANLDERVRAEGPQPELLVLSWADELLLILDYLHSQNPPIIHRDVKPANLKLRGDGSLVLVDFGIAKELVPGQFTCPAAAAVSPGYSPPEQYPGTTTTDARSDLYAAGATLYYLLTAAIPPTATERASGARSLVPAGALTQGLTPAAQVLVGRALKLKRDERWPSAAAMREAAANAADAVARTAPPPPQPMQRTRTPARPSHQPARIRRPVVMGAALVGVALLATVGVAWLPRIANVEGRVTATPTATRRPAAATVEPATAPATAATLPATVTLAPSPAPADTATPVPGPTAAKRPATATLIAAPVSASPVAAPIRSAAASATSALARIQSTPTRSPQPKPTLALQVTLLEPAPGSALSGLQAFTWQANQPPSDNQALELVFWRPGQDPLSDGLGIIGYSTEQAGKVLIELPSIEKQLGDLFRPGDYFWGVRWIQIQPYERFRMVSEPRAVRYGAGSAGSPPAAPPTAVSAPPSAAPPSAAPPSAAPPTPVPPTAVPPTAVPPAPTFFQPFLPATPTAGH